MTISNGTKETVTIITTDADETIITTTGTTIIRAITQTITRKTAITRNAVKRISRINPKTTGGTTTGTTNKEKTEIVHQ